MATKKGKRADAVSGLRTGVSGKSITSYDACKPNDLYGFVVGAVRAGALVSFSRTQDGGAVVLTILDDELPEGKYKDYFSSDEEIADMISKFAAIYADAE